jgi:hypothetical protein
MENCLIERRYGTNCFERMEKMSHRMLLWDKTAEKTWKNCPIECRYGTNCFERMKKMSHRSEQILPYGTKLQLKQGKLSHRTTLWDKLL